MKKPGISDDLIAFAAALEAVGIRADDVEVSLPLDGWQALARQLDAEGADAADDIGKLEVASVRYLIRSR
jgi:extradiol dioxygenase family protein